MYKRGNNNQKKIITMTKELELSTEQKNQISKVFEVQEIEVNGYANAYNHIVNQELTPQLSQQARELRLELRKERSSVNKTHKIQKAYFLNGGRFVDSLKNVLVDKIQNMESKLQEIEDYEKIQNALKIEKLQAERALKFSKYSENIPENLGEMDDAIFEATLIGMKAKFEQDERIRKEEEAKELELKQKNEMYNKRMFELQKYSLIYDVASLGLNFETSEEEYNKMLDVVTKAKNEHDNAEAERKSKLDAEARELAKEKAKIELARKREAERKAREEAERKAKLEAEKAERLKPIKDQLTNWVIGFNLDSAPVQNATTEDIMKKFNGFKSWALREIEKIN